MLELIKNNKPSTDFTERLQQLVNEAKNHNEKWRAEYMTLEMIKKEERYMGKTEGRKEGAHNKAVEAAKYLFTLNLTDDQIIAATGLSLEEVKRL